MCPCKLKSLVGGAQVCRKFSLQEVGFQKLSLGAIKISSVIQKTLDIFGEGPGIQVKNLTFKLF